jgi:hypothetical protein
MVDTAGDLREVLPAGDRVVAVDACHGRAVGVGAPIKRVPVVSQLSTTSSAAGWAGCTGRCSSGQ